MNLSRVVLLLASFFWVWPSLAADVGFEKGQVFADLSTFELEGVLPDMEGKVVLVDFWASWCAPCKASFPEMETVYSKYKDRGFEIIAVSVDSKKALMDKFITRAGTSFVAVHDGNKKLVEAAKVGVMPTSFLVDRKGIVRYVHEGWHGKKSAVALDQEVLELLEESL